MNIKEIRRENARLLAKQADKKFPIKGLAEKLGKPHALISHYIGKNPSKTKYKFVTQHPPRRVFLRL